MAGLIGVGGQGRVGDAPVDSARALRELGADLASLPAQADHVVKPAFDQPVHVPGPLAGDVDAELVVKYADAPC